MAKRAENTASEDGELSERTSREHETMVLATQSLERAVESRVPERQEAWLRRTRRELAKVVGLLQEHCESADGEDGLFTEVECRLGRTREVSEARRALKRLTRSATALLSALDDYAGRDTVGHRELRRRAGRLTDALRNHQEREASLLMFGLQQEVGVGD